MPLGIAIATSPVIGGGVDADTLVGNNLEFVDNSNIKLVDGTFLLQVTT